MGGFFKSKPFKIILAAAAVMFGMMLYSASSDGIFYRWSPPRFKKRVRF